jgi:hypothetical protein
MENREKNSKRRNNIRKTQSGLNIEELSEPGSKNGGLSD